MSPEAKRLLRPACRLRRMRAVDVTDAIVFLACTHLLALLLGYLWGHK